MQPQLLRYLALAGALAFATACSRTTSGNGAVPERAEATVRIENRSFSDMRIYAVRATQRIRLGLVTGNSSQDLRIPAHLVGTAAQLQIVADPVGGRAVRTSETFMVSPGDHLTMTISPP